MSIVSAFLNIYSVCFPVLCISIADIALSRPSSSAIPSSPSLETVPSSLNFTAVLFLLMVSRKSSYKENSLQDYVINPDYTSSGVDCRPRISFRCGNLPNFFIITRLFLKFFCSTRRGSSAGSFGEI